MALSFVLSCIHNLFTIIFNHIYVLFFSRANQYVQYIKRNESLFRKPSLRAYRAYHSTPRGMQKAEDDEVVNFEPLTGGSVPRYAGMATLMRLPHLDLSALKASNVVDVGLIGIPWVCVFAL